MSPHAMVSASWVGSSFVVRAEGGSRAAGSAAAGVAVAADASGVEGATLGFGGGGAASALAFGDGGGGDAPTGDVRDGRLIAARAASPGRERTVAAVPA
ncbi:MAG: hypothetical protein ABI276_00930, partial [Acidimicrobiales bacterium]